MAKIKIISLGTISVALMGIFAYFLSSFLAAGNLKILMFGLLAVCFWLILFSFQVFFMDSVQIAGLITFFEMGALGVFFLGQISLNILILILAALFGFLWWVYYGGVQERKNFFRIKYFRIALPAIAKASTLLAAFVAAVYLFSLKLDDPTASKKTLLALLKPMEPILANFLPGFRLESSLRSMAAGVLPAEAAVLPEAQRALVIDRTAQELSKQLGGLLGVKVNVQSKVIDIIYQATAGRLFQLPKIFQNLILFGVWLLIFLTIKAVLFIINWLALFIGFIISEILYSAGFYKITRESRSQEIIQL
jgi:hypothetical protein